MFAMKLPMYLRMADAGAGTSSGAGAAGAAAGGAAGDKPWYDGYDSETKGYVQNKGLDKKTATEAFLEVSKFHREAEKFVGAPTNEIVRLPKDPNAPEWKAVYERLGKPKEAKEYDLSTVKRAGDKAIDDALADTLRNAAFSSNLTKEGATRYASEIVKHLDAQDAARAALDADKISAEKAELKKNWGNNEAANMVVAQAAVRALGIDPAAVAALEKGVGYSKVMEMFRSIGTKIGEDKFVRSENGGTGVMTRDQAASEKKAKMSDKAWSDRYLKGGVEEQRQMLVLNKIITGTA